MLTPATPARLRQGGQHASTLNEGRGAYPGDTAGACLHAQRRPGCLPRRHPRRARPKRYAQRRPGCLPRRHLLTSGLGVWRLRSTKAGVLTPATLQGGSDRTPRAQRRPGCLPRRHSRCQTVSPYGPSVAQRRPGCLPRRHPCSAGRGRQRAQRRPGCLPRRHIALRTIALGLKRSTKAGVLTPATLVNGSAETAAARSPLNEGRGAYPGDTAQAVGLAAVLRRSTKAGVLTPATPGVVDPKTATRSLNEGRGAYPGDTWRTSPKIASAVRFAQRRPGCLPRRHLQGFSSIAIAIVARSTKAGVLTPATLVLSRLHLSSVADRRSTKAGVLTPATPPAAHRVRVVWLGRSATSLNEGRGAYPGDTLRARNWRLSNTASLNEGRGAYPGDTASHGVKRSSFTLVPFAQRRPGCLPRRHHANRRPDAHRRQLRPLNEGRGAYPGDT